jgi:hypothetical protein
MTRADHLAAHRSSRLDSTRPPGSALWVAPAMSAAADSEPDVVEAEMPVRQAREVAEARRPRDEHAMESRPWCSVAALFVGARRYTRRTSPRSSRSTAGQAPGSTRPNRERTRRPNGDLLLATDSKVTVRVSRALQRHIGGAIRSGDTTSLIDDVPRRCAPRAAPRRPQPAQQRPHRRLLQATAALTPLSCVRSVAWPDDVSTKVALLAIHLLAAAVIVPVLVRHAHDRLARHASSRLPRCTGQVVRRQTRCGVGARQVP